MDKYSVKFAGNDLALVSGVDLYNHNFNDLPVRDIKINKLARRDLSIITSSEYTQKTIPVWLEICSGTRADTENTLAFVKSLLQPQNEQLIVSQGGVDVEYTSTMNEFNIDWNGTRALVNVIFLASNPIGQESDTQILASLAGVTTATSSYSNTVEGSATAYPVITVAINSITGGTDKQITISNGKTGQGITIEGTWEALDILVIDSLNMNVTVNGASVDFTGMFPQFPAGQAQITYIDDFTTRNISLTAVYNPRLV